VLSNSGGGGGGGGASPHVYSVIQYYGIFENKSTEMLTKQCVGLEI
jgi:hypothetical protein